ncbi:MAG: YceI family protein [Desulfobacterota bacterium]|nr:YceI family protein [Thermodesulfobacteriota bacterium]
MEQWRIDPDHTVAAFEVRHCMITLVRGQFNRISGTLRFDPAAPALGSVAAEIEAAGVYTGIAKRDEHLCSPDFLEVERFPLIRFQSTRIDPVALNRFACIGDLTIRDVTRPIILDVEYLGRVKSPFDDDISIGFSATGRINRRDFGVNWNYDLENGGLVAGNDLMLRLEVEADLVE